MPLRLARSLLTRLTSAGPKPARPGASTSARCAAEPLDERRLLTVTIVTPYQHDAEGYTAAFVADFTSSVRPTEAVVDWSDGTTERLEATMMDFVASSDPAVPGTGRLHGIHDYPYAGDFAVTFTIKESTTSTDSETFLAS